MGGPQSPRGTYTSQGNDTWDVAHHNTQALDKGGLPNLASLNISGTAFVNADGTPRNNHEDRRSQAYSYEGVNFTPRRENSPNSKGKQGRAKYTATYRATSATASNHILTQPCHAPFCLSSS